MAIELRDLHPGDLPRIAAVKGGPAWNAGAALWQGYLAEQAAGRRVVQLAWDGDGPVGYGTLAWESDYGPFRAATVPEINNLVAAAPARGRGVGTMLIRAFEDLARASGRTTTASASASMPIMARPNGSMPGSATARTGTASPGGSSRWCRATRCRSTTTSCCG